MWRVLLLLSVLSSSAWCQNEPLMAAKEAPSTADPNAPEALLSDQNKERRRMLWCPTFKSKTKTLQLLKIDTPCDVSIVPTPHGMLAQTETFYVIKKDPKTGKPLKGDDGNFVLDGQFILISGKPGTSPLIMQMFDTPPRIQYTRIPLGTALIDPKPTPQPDDPDGPTNPLGLRTIPKATAPSADLQSKVSDFKAWCGKNKTAAAWFTEYFYDWKLMADGDAKLWPNVQRVRDHNFAAMRLWNKSTPDLKVTSDPMNVLNKTMLAVFGDVPSTAVSESDLQTKLNAMVWACQ